jgi:hypothetical protein
MSAGWHTIVVRVPMAPEREAGLRTLRRMERWLAEHHRPMPLFHADGQPRSEAVCVAIPVENAGKALAFRSFCSELGLSGSMVQWRVTAWRAPPGNAARPASGGPAGLLPRH